jgi:Uma2 family endonuclease
VIGASAMPYNTAVAAPPTAVEEDIDYPTSDAKALAETPIHRQDLSDPTCMIDSHFKGQTDFYVSGNMFLYFESGNVKKCVAPDVFFLRGVLRGQDRDGYKTWEERGKGPALVIELTSRKTKTEDIKKEFSIYRNMLRVREYVLFDPWAESLNPLLQAYCLAGGAYVPNEPFMARYPSDVLGLHFERNGSQLRLYDFARGTWVPTPKEAIEPARTETRRAREELADVHRRQGQTR